jgi:hypothetical protein
MSRAHALRRLAQEFPPDVERQLSAEGRRTLRDLGREHVAALARQSGEMDAALSRMLTSLGGTGPRDSPGIGRVAARQRGIAERRTAGRDGSRGATRHGRPAKSGRPYAFPAPVGAGAT